MNYQQLIHQVLGEQHQLIEEGLCKARRQQGFIQMVADRLSRTVWTHHMYMDQQFNVVFVMEPAWMNLSHQLDAIRQTLNTLFDVEEKHYCLWVYDTEARERCCRIVFGDKDDH
ncbi:hypothetical protein PT286_04820 [Neisseriaceae bacterium ESL0693]|nr:hypothetical protein [Neisseriaceae bacterium ESL0693]